MKTKSKVFKVAATLMCSTLLFACSNDSSSLTTNDVKAQKVTTDPVGTEKIMASINEMVKYDEDDYYSDWEKENPTYIELNGSEVSFDKQAPVIFQDRKVTIKTGGTYVISGKLDDGQIVVDAEDKSTVRLVLNGVNINSIDSSAIYVVKAEKTTISLEEGTENYLSDGQHYNTEEDEPNAALFSKDDLTINGTGKLVVTGNFNNGIACKDELKIIDGTIEIDSVDDGLLGRDLIAVKTGNIVIEAGGDGIKSTNDKDTLKGNIALEGGTFEISAGDDGIHAESAVEIYGGKINITKSYEGLEGKLIVVNDGEIHIVSGDDGINVAGGNDGSGFGRTEPNSETKGNSNTENKLMINGGYIFVNADGDGLDSNGSIYITDGTVLVNGPTENMNGSLDYDQNFEMSGGFLIAAGSSGMVQATSEQSTQNSILMTYPKTQSAGTIVNLQDSEGHSIVSFAPAKEYRAVFISSPKLTKDASYTLFSGGKSIGVETDGLYGDGFYEGGTKVVTFTISDSVTWLNESGVTTARSSGPGGFGRPEGMNPGGDPNRSDRNRGSMFADLDEGTRVKLQEIIEQERQGTITREEAQVKIAELGIEFPGKGPRP